METIKVLLVDDEPLLGKPLQRALEGNGFKVRLAVSGAEALEAINQERFDVLLEDLRLPDADGMDIMKEVLRKNSHCKALVITGHGTIKIAVEAMKNGAMDFVTKPFSMDSLLTKLKRCTEIKLLEQELDETVPDDISNGIWGHSPPIMDMLKVTRLVATTDSTVLITGESGTGKELLAQYIHDHSPRRTKACIQVNCAAIPINLFEGELFGVERGAYTDAHCSRAGYLQAAEGGTLFLDEIAELPLAVQAKLLRALDEKTIYRVGGNKSYRVDFRLIAATNRNLHHMVGEGLFRNDLFFRLNVVPITMPPLRERKEDIPLLMALFQKRFQKAGKGSGVSFSPEALESLCDYHYPGNVRELKNLIEHLCTIYPGETIKKRHLMATMYDSNLVGQVFESFSIGKPLKEVVAEFERKYIHKVMESVGGHKARCAHILGLSRKVLWERIKKTEAE